MQASERSERKNSHPSQPTANNSEPSSYLSNKTFKDILQKETVENSSREMNSRQSYQIKESVIFSVVYVLFINRFKLLGLITGSPSSKYELGEHWHCCVTFKI